MAVTQAELTDWPPQAPDMNLYLEYTEWCEKIMQQTWPNFPLTKREALLTLVSGTWDEVASS
jgi:hypothetical protein